MRRIGAILLLWVFLSIPCCLCGSIPGIGKLSPTASSTVIPSETPHLVHPIVKPTVTQTLTQPGVKMGNIIRCDECGFSFEQIPGFKISNFGMIEELAPDDADPDAGPDIQMIGGQAKSGLTENTFIDSITGLQNDKSDFTISPQKNILVGNKPAVSFDVSYTINNIPVRGRRYGVLIPNKQILMLFAVAPVDQWNKMLPYVEALKNSITFFNPAPAQ